jgi:hypothetical protein
MFRYPVKGFTPEQLQGAALHAGVPLAGDRLFAVEDGPSGFDPARPAFIPKTKFVVLMNSPCVARVKTRYEDASGVLHVRAEGCSPIAAALHTELGRVSFAGWLAEFLDRPAAPLKVVTAEGHHFFDNPKGHLSLINLNTLRELEGRMGEAIDPRRFRANIYFDGWPPLSELELQPGAELSIGDARAVVVKSIQRCLATHADPELGIRNREILPSLERYYGHNLCGIYVQIVQNGAVAPGAQLRAH